MNKIYLLSPILLFFAVTMVSCTQNKIDNFYQSEFVPVPTSINMTVKVELQNTTDSTLTSHQERKGRFFFDKAIQMDIESQDRGCRLRAINH